MVFRQVRRAYPRLIVKLKPYACECTLLSVCRGNEGRSAAENQQVDEVYDIYWRAA